MGLLRALFVKLKDDCLAFLSACWSTSVGADDETLGTAALRHAAAFLEAHLSEGDGVDFQTILPSILVALQSSDRQRRQLACECISLLLKLAKTQKFVKVYAFDVIYGDNGGKCIAFLALV